MPEEGDVICYSYLWRHEHDEGREEGRKDRPCLVIVSEQRADVRRVIVAPVTTQNLPGAISIKIPADCIARLKLDPKSLVIATDLNVFDWVGPDVRPRGKNHTHYGALPAGVTDAVLSAAQKAGARPTRRTV